jgi:autotransporter-associated beta strand protein
MVSTLSFIGHCNALGPTTLFSSQFFRLSLFALFIALISGTPPATAQVQADNWTNAGTGSWFTPGNWSLDTVPTAAINAVVDNGGKALVTGANATVGNLTIGATTAGSTVEVSTGTSLTITALTIGPAGTLISDPGSVFTQSGGFVNNGSLVVTAGTFNSAPITGNGTVTKNDFGETVFWQAPLQAGSRIVVNAGTFVDESTVVGAVSVTGTGTFQVNAGFSLTQGATLNNGGALDNFGNATGPADGVVSNAGGAVVTNETSGVITGGTGNGVNFAAGGTVTNLGRITASQFDGIRFQGAGLTGTVINNAGAVIQGATVQGALAVGVGTLNGATLNLTNSGTITGTIGVGLDQGGTIINNAGGTITGTLLPAIEVIGNGNIVVFSNAGAVNSDVDLGKFANAVTLITGDTINGSLNGGSATQASLTLDGTGSELISQAVTGTISGFSSLTKQGAGTWTIDETLAYGGGTIISGGTLRIGNGGTAGSIIGNVVNNATLAFDRSDNITFGGTISGTGVLTQAGSGTLTLTGNNTYTGGTTISSGTLQIGAGGSAGSIAGNVADNGILAFDRSDLVTFSGVISGAGSVRELGGGTLMLAGNNTYSGGTAVDNGTLIVAATNALGTGPVNVNDATQLEINSGVTVTNSIAINNGSTMTNGGTIQVAAAPGGPTAAVTTSGAATINNASGGMITGFGLIGIQSLSGAATNHKFRGHFRYRRHPVLKRGNHHE